jgi:hypothetical protein
MKVSGLSCEDYFCTPNTQSSEKYSNANQTLHNPDHDFILFKHFYLHDSMALYLVFMYQHYMVVDEYVET